MGYTVGGSTADSAVTEQGRAGPSDDRKKVPDDDANIRFTMSSGRRLKKEEFIEEIQKLDPKARARLVEDQDAPDRVKREIGRKAVVATEGSGRRPSTAPADSRSHSSEDLQQVESIPSHPVADTLAHFVFDNTGRETAAQRRRRLASPQQLFQHVEDSASDSESDPDPGDTPRRSSAGKPPDRPSLSAIRRASSADAGPTSSRETSRPQPSYLEEAETEAEKRRRQAALGLTRDDDSSDDEEDTGFRDPNKPRSAGPARVGSDEPESSAAVLRGRRNIRFAEAEESPRSSVGPRLRWGDDVGRRP